MNFDTFSVAAMAAELRDVLIEGRVQEVTQVNSLAFGFEIYVYPVRHYLILSAEPQAPRLHLTEERVRRGVGNDTPLMLVLRKYMRGAVLEKIEQPPYERVLQFYFKTRFGLIILTLELLGTRSNLLLLAEDRSILGVARLPKSSGSAGQRHLLPNHFYTLPPSQSKALPTQVTELSLRQEFSEASPQMKLSRLLPQIITGISPFLAREIVYRATGQVNTTVGQVTGLSSLLDAFHQLFSCFWENKWQPMLVLDAEDRPIAFAPYAVQHQPHTQPMVTFSAAVEIYFIDITAGYVAAKAPLIESIKEARRRLKRRHARLVEDAAAQANPEMLKEMGETILAYAHEIQPGQRELVAAWALEGLPLTVKLDPALSASDNAQQYFGRYRKALRAADEIPGQLKKIELEQIYLDQLEQDLAMAENRPEIDAIAGVLAEAGYRKAKRGRKKRYKKAGARALRLVAPDGATVWVGKNALQNADLTFNRASPDDLWLHARDIPGAHVLIPTAEGLPTEADVFWAAGVAAHYSKARRDTSVEVDVTLKKYVRAIKGAAPGLVTYRNESTLRVAPEIPDLEYFAT